MKRNKVSKRFVPILPSIRKVIYNGQVYILRTGNTYTLTGTEIK